jgi:hypothetical protein
MSEPDIEADGQPVDAQASDGPSKVLRERSTIAFPYEDLKAVTEAVTIAHHDYGGTCGFDQLAARLNQSSTSGAFRLKVSAARIFGLATTANQAMHVTDLGSQIGDDRTSPAARVEAFMLAPLYGALYERFKGRTLPSDTGLEAVMRELGVTPKQATTARQVFQRSAEFAGFFAHGRDRLVPPAGAKMNATEPHPSQGVPNGAEQPSEDPPLRDTAIMRNRLILGLLESLPDPDEGDFPEDQRKLWMATLEMNLAWIYSKPKTWAYERPEPTTSHHGSTNGSGA